MCEYERYWRNPLGIVERANHASQASGFEGRTGGPRDAVRHVLASAELSLKYGALVAESASLIRETLGDNPPAEAAMDLHNDGVGRRLANKHGSMQGVIDEALDRMADGPGNGELEPTWVTNDPPPSRQSVDRAKQEVKQTYSTETVEQHKGTETVTDENDDRLHKRNENVAKTTPDGPDSDDGGGFRVVVLLLLWILALNHALQQLTPPTEGIFEPDIGDEERKQRLAAFLVNSSSARRGLAFLTNEDEGNPETRRKILELIRRAWRVEIPWLQPGWTDPPRLPEERRSRGQRG